MYFNFKTDPGKLKLTQDWSDFFTNTNPVKCPVKSCTLKEKGCKQQHKMTNLEF